MKVKPEDGRLYLNSCDKKNLREHATTGCSLTTCFREMLKSKSWSFLLAHVISLQFCVGKLAEGQNCCFIRSLDKTTTNQKIWKIAKRSHRKTEVSQKIFSLHLPVLKFFFFLVYFSKKSSTFRAACFGVRSRGGICPRCHKVYLMLEILEIPWDFTSDISLVGHPAISEPLGLR